MIDEPAEEHITLAHGNGGRFMRELIEDVITPAFGSRQLNTRVDAAGLGEVTGEIFVTTDGFTVQPLDFPGGDIGSLAVHGTVNDLAVAGVEPRWLTVNFFIEEGLSIEDLHRYATSMGTAARAAGVDIVAGDTKVLPRGHGGGLYLVTTGVGVITAGTRPSMDNIKQGDAVLVSGSIGDHGVAVLLAREAFGLEGELLSDAATVLPLTRALGTLSGLRFMRDPTRGGLVSVVHEISVSSQLSVTLEAASVPVQPQVEGVCDMLGYDPYYLACEGRVVAIVAADQAEQALSLWRALPQGRGAQIIGTISAGPPRVLLQTPLGGQRILEELEDDPLPRIC